MKAFQLTGRAVGIGHPTFIIAEIGLVHDGSLGMAHSYIDAVADTGADAIKFQTHIAEAESTSDEAFRLNCFCQDDIRYDYWMRTGFTFEQWEGLFEHCTERGLCFLSTPFSTTAVDWLQKIGVPGWKIGSGDLTNQELRDALMATRKPVIFSAGLAFWEEVEAVAEEFCSRNIPVAILQCTSKYPSPLDETGLNVIDDIQSSFGIPSGLSDHSGTVFPGLAAVARGVPILEVHVVFDKRMFGPDVKASITLENLVFLVKSRDMFGLISKPVNKDAEAIQMGEMRNLFGRSLALKQDLEKGTVLSSEHLTLKKPGTGISPNAMQDIIGESLKTDVSASRLLRYKDIGWD